MEAIRYHNKREFVHGLLVKETRKRVHVILMQPGIHVTKLPVSERRYITPITVPIRRAKKELRQAARIWGNKLSKECRSYLRQGA